MYGILFNHESPRRGETLLRENNHGLTSIDKGIEDCFMSAILTLKEIGAR